MQPTLGAYSSGHDYRDGIAALASVMPAATKSEELHTDLGGVLDQNKIPACVSHSITYLVRHYWFKKLGRWIDFSPRFLDILSDEAWIPLDGGRVPRTVLKIALSKGIPTTKTLPNDTSLSIAAYRNKGAITQAALDEAKQYRIPGFVRLQTTPQATRDGLHLYGAVSTLYSIGNELWMPSWRDTDIDPLRPPRAIVGGHQMTPCGLKASGMATLRNQWSEEWARKGEADYSPEAWSPYTSEQWAIAEIPKDTAEFLKKLPSPSAFTYQWNENLSQGQTGEAVQWLQVALMILGFLPPLSPDQLGTFGPKTAAAVGAFQAFSRIVPAPASVGPKTRAALNAKFAP